MLESLIVEHRFEKATITKGNDKLSLPPSYEQISTNHERSQPQRPFHRHLQMSSRDVNRLAVIEYEPRPYFEI